jgi:hypothetical protein
VATFFIATLQINALRCRIRSNHEISAKLLNMKGSADTDQVQWVGAGVVLSVARLG